MNKNFFQIKNLSIDLKTFQVKNVSFSIDKGDYLCIIGPTGAGKTVLLESIIGICKTNSGNIILNQKDITKLPPEKRGIGIIYQDYALFPHFSVKKNIEYGLNSKHADSDNKILEICRLLKIDQLLNRLPDTLSGGEKQRVALARALVAEPELLLMDEPFSALDLQTRLNIRQLVKKISKKLNITVIHITHDFDDIFTLAAKIGIIRDGRLIQFGTKEEVLSKPETNFAAEFVGTNILEGKVADYKNGLTIIDFNGTMIKSIDKKAIGESIKFAVRPENIILFKKLPENLSARNVIVGEFVEHIILNNVCYVILKLSNFKIKALLTISAFEEFGFKKGDKVFLIIKATNVRIV